MYLWSDLEQKINWSEEAELGFGRSALKQSFRENGLNFHRKSQITNIGLASREFWPKKEPKAMVARQLFYKFCSII